MGVSADKAANRSALANPDALEYFIEFAKRSAISPRLTSEK